MLNQVQGVKVFVILSAINVCTGGFCIPKLVYVLLRCGVNYVKVKL